MTPQTAADFGRLPTEIPAGLIAAGGSELDLLLPYQKRLLETTALTSVVVVEKGAEVGAHILSGAVIDPIGLDIIEQRYLHLLRESQGTLRLNVIASSLGLPRATLERSIEPFLIRAGLIQKDDAGRSLTDRGWEHVGTETAVTSGTSVPPSEGA